MSFSVREVVTIFLVRDCSLCVVIRAANNVMLDLDLESLMQIQMGVKAQNLADVPAAVCRTQENIAIQITSSHRLWG